ncbi:MAG: DUF4197 domain-containing protein [Crocinitomicaceae bacterium]|nr:DUF4197 domain-containing protein [Crocinitomicaceae bacterium]
MKKTLLIALIGGFFMTNNANAQILNKLKKTVEETVDETVSGGASGLTEEEVGAGLKEALTKGIEAGVAQVSQPDGYFKDLAIKIFLPEEAKKVESALRDMGQGDLVDDAIESLNRAAEDAANGALEIFVDAIKNMSIQDAMSILNGEDNAATTFLERVTRDALVAKFKPIVKASLDKVGATKYWNTIFTTYNKIPFVQKINPDLDDFATNRAIDGLFVQIAKQEKDIRENPLARVTDLLKKVFGN